MKVTRKDWVIIRCARRLIDKLESGHTYIWNDEFSKNVQLELKRLKDHCEQARKEERGE